MGKKFLQLVTTVMIMVNKKITVQNLDFAFSGVVTQLEPDKSSKKIALLRHIKILYQ